MGRSKRVLGTCMTKLGNCSFLALTYEDTTTEIIDLESCKTVRVFETGIVNIKSLYFQSLLNQSNETALHSVFYNTRATVTHFHKFTSDFNLISNNTVQTEDPVVSITGDEHLVYLLTNSEILFFNLLTDTIDFVYNLNVSGVKDFLFVKKNLFILNTRTKVFVLDLIKESQTVLENEPGLFMTKSGPINGGNTHLGMFQENSQKQAIQSTPTQSPSIYSKDWFVIIYRESIQILNSNLQQYRRIPLMNRLNCITIFDHQNIFWSAYRKIIWYCCNETVQYEEHENSISHIHSFLRNNGHMGVASVSANGEILITEWYLE